MNINYDDLNVLQKYLYNQVNYSVFLEGMMIIYNDENYIKPLWKQFQSNGIGFIISRSERKFFDWLLKRIETENYKG